MLRLSWVLLATLCTSQALAAGSYYTVEYEPSTEEGQLPYGVTYTVWIPDGIKTVRGVIVHQHGCGAGACKGGRTAAYDLHWQALAKKWDCALLGPSYHQEDGQDCRLWCDPRNGSEAAFLKGLSDLAEKSKHPELRTAPWCLWGHSGGGFWASLMHTRHPERIVAIWFRSGTAHSRWIKDEIDKPEMPESMYQIPMVCNPGLKEKGHERFNGAYTGTLAMFEAYRAKGAPIAFAPDPQTSHQCGDSRYLAIPFFDACLQMRLPQQPGDPLRPVNQDGAWLADVHSDTAVAASDYEGDKLKAVWLPSESVAKAWMEYVKSGATSDNTPPAAPHNVQARRTDAGVLLTWDAAADFESGLQAFVIERDGKTLAQFPEKPVGRFGRALFQQMSYHDTPEAPVPEMRYVDQTAPEAGAEYRVIAVNSVGLKSEPSAAARVK